MSEWVRLGDVASISAGGTPSRSNNEYWENGTIPWVKIGDINGKYLYSTEETISELGLKNSSAKVFPEGTILFSIFATLGAVTILKIEAATNQAIVGIQFNEHVNQSYGYYFLQSLKDTVENKGRGVAQLNINQSILKNIKIPLLSQTEQQHIVSVLDTVSSLIDARKKQIALLDEAEKSLFVEMFGDPLENPKGWDIVNVDSVCSKITDGEHQTPTRVESSDIYLLSARNILNHSLQLDDVDYIDESEYLRISKRIKPQANDILISCSGSVGRVCRVPDNLKIHLVRSVAILRPLDCLLPQFFEWILLSDYVQNQIQRVIHQSSQANLFQGQIKKLNIILPPLHLQKDFAARISAIEERRREMEAGLQQMEEARSALMQEYFGC